MNRKVKDVNFVFKQKTEYEICTCLVGSEMCVRKRFRTGAIGIVLCPPSAMPTSLSRASAAVWGHPARTAVAQRSLSRGLGRRLTRR